MNKLRTPEVLAPVNSLEEVAPLLEAGASWLYGGALPAEWAGRYPSTVLLNQRTFAGAQFRSMGELRRAVLQTRDHGGSFAVTLNAPFYMDEQVPLALEVARWAADSGAAALIVADPGLIGVLREKGLHLPLHLSTMGLAANHLSVRMYRNMGVTRVILPRFLNLAQISSVVSAEPEMEYEAFVLVGKCPYIEGLCTFDHDSPDQRWPCEWEWDVDGEFGESLPQSVSGHFAGIRGSDRRDGCGLCALPALVSAGVSTFKIVGRGAPLARKVSLTGQLRRLLGELPPQGDPGWLGRCMAIYESLYGHRCTEHHCYYPDVVSRLREGQQ